MLRKSQYVSLIAVFSALNVVFDLIVGLPSSGVWYGLIFIAEPINGIILGPYAGFLSTLIGVMIGHFIVPRETVYELLFTLGAPIGALISGLLYRGKWRAVLVYYVTLLVIYFSTPITRLLPIWGMWDTYLALIAVLFFGENPSLA